MTIRLAFGTSTPTSITVVATSTPMRARVNAAITAAFSAAGMRPCSSPTWQPGSAAASTALSWACVAVAFCRSSDSLSSINGHTQ